MDERDYRLWLKLLLIPTLGGVMAASYSWLFGVEPALSVLEGGGLLAAPLFTILLIRFLARRSARRWWVRERERIVSDCVEFDAARARRTPNTKAH
mgnify:CR=1 FL=1